MLNSVRVRLTLWYAAVLTCVLVAMAFATYFLLRQDSAHRTDTAIVEMADSFLTTVKAESRDATGPDGLKTAIEEAIAEHKYRDTVFVVLDQEGKIVASSGDLLLKQPPSALVEILQEAMGRGEIGVRPFRTVRLRDEVHRSYVRRFSIGKEEYTLLVLQSLHRQREFLESLITAFGLAIPLAILLASGGGYFLARRSLSPVVEMSTQAGRIGADNLHQRLPIRNAQDELGHLAASFNNLLDRLDQSFEQQRRFMADASHELRTPVAILCGEADVTLSQPSRSPEDYRASLDILRAEARTFSSTLWKIYSPWRVPTPVSIR